MTNIPLPGGSVRGSKTGNPIMALFDLMGRQWAMRILWEVWQGPVNFTALQIQCGMSPTILSRRLKELIAAGLLNKTDNKTYELTMLGIDLQDALDPVRSWAGRWVESQQDENCSE